MHKYQGVSLSEANQVHGPRPGSRLLSDIIVSHYFNRGMRSLGIYNRRRVRGGTALSTHAGGRGIDFGVPSANGRATASGKKLGDELVLKLIHASDALGIQEIIWQGKRITAGPKGVPVTKPYRGLDRHFTHVHASQTVDLASRNADANLAKWYHHFLGF